MDREAGCTILVNVHVVAPPWRGNTCYGNCKKPRSGQLGHKCADFDILAMAVAIVGYHGF